MSPRVVAQQLDEVGVALGRGDQHLQSFCGELPAAEACRLREDVAGLLRGKSVEVGGPGAAEKGRVLLPYEFVEVDLDAGECHDDVCSAADGMGDLPCDGADLSQARLARGDLVDRDEDSAHPGMLGNGHQIIAHEGTRGTLCDLPRGGEVPESQFLELTFGLPG